MGERVELMVTGNINWPRVFAEYVTPESHLAAAIQYPMSDKAWPDRVVTAYMRDWRKSRRQSGADHA